MMHLFFIILLATAFPLLVLLAIYKTLFKKHQERSSRALDIDQAELAAAEQALKDAGARDWVILKRCHGPAYSHTAMSELVSALGAEGVEATYDVVSSSSADGGVTNFMLKVLRQDEEKAAEILARLQRS